MDLDIKIATASDTEALLEVQFADSHDVLSALALAWADVQTAGSDAKAIVENAVGDIAKTTSLHCLAGQLPVPGVDTCYSKVVACIAAIASGDWYDTFLNYMNQAVAAASDADAITALTALQAAANDKINALSSVVSALGAVESLQEEMQTIIGMVGAMVGCMDGVSGTLAPVDDILFELAPVAYSAVISIRSAEDAYDSKIDIITDAKTRAAANADLDSRMASVTAALQAAIDDVE